MKSWGESLNLDFPLLSDFNREAMSALGIMAEDHGGYRDVSRRAIFVVDRDGKIAYTDVRPPRETPDVEAALAKVREIAGSQS
jgi:glutaredoxin-dependent peroxiredoxin